MPSDNHVRRFVREGILSTNAPESSQAGRTACRPSGKAWQRTRGEGGKPGWYVVQVRTGKEQAMCETIERACVEHDGAACDEAHKVVLRECFSPRFVSQKKRRGEWVDVQRSLLPGYVVADVDNPAMLVQALSGVRELCRVLSPEETYEPLSGYERDWIASYTKKGERVVPMSFGYREGEKLVVERGPLRGNEARIVRVDRANSLAHLEFHVGPMRIKTTVGLGIVSSMSSDVNRFTLYESSKSENRILPNRCDRREDEDVT